MKDLSLFSYAVRGIKTLDKWARLSFYKKTVTKNINLQNYNIKGIYGANGSGKSAIITSVKILKDIITNPGYLNNPINQKQLGELINKNLGVLEYDIEFLYTAGKIKIYRYQVTIARDRTGKYHLDNEKLTYRIATSHTNQETVIYQVFDGTIVSLMEDDSYAQTLRENTKNLLSYASLTTVGIEKTIFDSGKIFTGSVLEFELIIHYLFASGIFAYLEQEDEHADFFVRRMLEADDEDRVSDELYSFLMDRMNGVLAAKQYLLSPGTMLIPKDRFTDFKAQINQLEAFLKIFKRDLLDILIDRREDKDHYYCNLLMRYEGYTINTEFESTGIKKLIKLFPYLQKMANGSIVFIDELDSNLHDVYLCALLEYLREYGKGQLCFTSHNIGPMDVLKQNKQAIDFLSADRQIYSWVTNGNYSPSRLYKNGMIEGSPFNIDALDFLGVFGEEGD